MRPQCSQTITFLRAKFFYNPFRLAKLWFDTMLNGYESIGINETTSIAKKRLKYVMNLLGKIVNPKTITGDVILLYVYDDGSVEKKINMITNSY